MRVKFKDRIKGCIFLLSDIFKVNDWSVMRDEFNVQYDELEGKKRIIITREKK